MMIRALARGWNVAVVQFIKSGDWNVGEEKMGRQLGVDWHAFGDGFTWDSDDLANDTAHAAEGWAKAVEIMNAGEHQLVIFDELTYLSSFGWLDDRRRSSARSRSPAHVNVIVTGRDAAPELIEIADTVTEMREVKHAYHRGSARCAASTTDVRRHRRMAVDPAARRRPQRQELARGRHRASPRRAGHSCDRSRPRRSVDRRRHAHRIARHRAERPATWTTIEETSICAARSPARDRPRDRSTA